MSEWKTFRIADVTTNHNARRVPIKSLERKRGQFPYYGASGIVDHIDDYIFNGEYLLIAEDGENLRTRKTPIAFIAAGKFWVNNHAHVVQGNELANSQFLAYALSKTDISGYLSGSTQPKLTKASLNGMLIRLPERNTQDSIVAILKALDDKIAVNDLIMETALDLADHCYLKSSYSPSWKSITLESAAKWLSGGTPKTSEQEFWNGNIPWISAKSLKTPLIRQSDRNLTKLGVQSGTRMVGKDAIIFVVRGSSLKEEFRVGITQREVAFGQDCKALVAKEDIDPHTLFHAIRSRTPEILNMVDETGIGAGRLSTDLISKLEIQVPATPKDETSARLRFLDEKAANSQSEIQSLTELRDTLLPQLMSGKLRVKDAEKIVEDNV
ncbi:restriction endonuclease subunit S [Nocardiopsis alborubida]|uniref:restriction endonuclease subunit S n=1 Tax=Nocardiopsis alborubida TaxID=146802 RepID=UPI0009E866D5|nr:restriction endonuclease subunit S [Nocardiopsis alborubida]